MGRYYQTESGREGKFGFGSQPSTDPGDFFDMDEQEPSEITYILDERNKDMVKDAGLCCSRVRLGLVILSDLEDDGFCELRAEL